MSEIDYVKKLKSSNGNSFSEFTNGVKYCESIFATMRGSSDFFL